MFFFDKNMKFGYICLIKILGGFMAYVISSDCIECGTCIPECPVNAITEGTPYKIDPSTCTDCGNCASVCPADAISQA